MADLVVGGGPSGSTLAGSTCGACGFVAFPAEPFGCERCGALPAELAPTALPATGTVRSSATVHRHAPSEPATPFVVVEVALDAGPAVTALLLDGPGTGVGIGTRVRGVGDPAVGFGFTAAGAA